jgi:hypothetical protein
LDVQGRNGKRCAKGLAEVLTVALEELFLAARPLLPIHGKFLDLVEGQEALRGGLSWTFDFRLVK